MLSEPSAFRRIVEVNPPDLPNMDHLLLEGAWNDVLVTDNVFGRIRVSPYAFAARITHDVPSVDPTVVVSTRDRNILAIESEVRGALGNGVRSFLVVVGDTLPSVDHLADHYEIVRHLRDLQDDLPKFTVGMPTRFAAIAGWRLFHLPAFSLRADSWNRPVELYLNSAATRPHQYLNGALAARELYKLGLYDDIPRVRR